MRAFASLVLTLLLASGLPAQTLKTGPSYEDRAEATGHTVVLDGKAYGPYREVTVATSTSGTAVAFTVVKRDRLWVLAQGRESGPIPAGFELDRLQVADDGKVWVLTATRTSSNEDEPNQTLLMVNGKTYGPYPELTTVEYAETGGAWIAAVRTAPEEADVLVTGKAQGPFYGVDHAWITPDGREWGYAVADSEGRATVVTSDKTWDNVQDSNFTNLYPREPHWGYSLRLANDEERIIVDGQNYEGYRNFGGLMLTPSGRHWGFEAEKLTGGASVVVIDGKEYPGQNLQWSRLRQQESYTWTVTEGSRVTVETMKLP
jgi:hypothetical protein